RAIWVSETSKAPLAFVGSTPSQIRAAFRERALAFRLQLSTTHRESDTRGSNLTANPRTRSRRAPTPSQRQGGTPLLTTSRDADAGSCCEAPGGEQCFCHSGHSPATLAPAWPSCTVTPGSVGSTCHDTAPPLGWLGTNERSLPSSEPETRAPCRRTR